MTMGYIIAIPTLIKSPSCGLREVQQMTFDLADAGPILDRSTSHDRDLVSVAGEVLTTYLNHTRCRSSLHANGHKVGRE
jgi:hypothetical protein